MSTRPRTVMILASVALATLGSPVPAQTPLPFEGIWNYRESPGGRQGRMTLTATQSTENGEICIFDRVTRGRNIFFIDERCNGERLRSSIRIDGPDRLTIRFRILSTGETGTRRLVRLPASK